MKKITSKDGTSIAFDQSGKGLPVILIDGALCSRSFGPMPKLAPLLAEHFTVFTYDRRGRGDSGDSSAYAVRREVEDLEALITEAGGSAFVYAISSGAALALEAANSGLKIKRLALYEPPLMVDEHGNQSPSDYQPRVTQLISMNRRSDAVRLFMRMVGVPSFFIFFMRLMPVWPKLKAVAPTLPYDATIMADFSIPKMREASIRVPTLVLGGSKSPDVLRRAVQTVTDFLPNSQSRILEGQNHDVSSKVLAPVLAEFFSGN